jgi:type IV pilus assembly protein PilE
MTVYGRVRGCAARHTAHGFTLIELMITIVVLAILVSIAYPAYQDQMRKARRAEAQIALIELANLEERYFANISPPRYTTTIVGSNFLNYTSTSSGGNYTLSISSTDVTTRFTAQAQVAAGSKQAGDTRCWTFTLTNLGVRAVQEKTTNADTTTECWRQ